MNKNKLPWSLLLFTIIIVIIPFLSRYNIEKELEFEAENDERPDSPILSGEEKALFLNYLEQRNNQPMLKSAQLSGGSSYVNGKLTGIWQTKISHSGWFGYRVDNSAYDSLRNEFYVVSYAGHLYKLQYENEIKWTLLNHKIKLNEPNNNPENPVFMGTLLSDSTFRLLRSNDDVGRMEYSDDEGRNWLASTGARVTRSPSNQIFEITNNGQKRIVLHTYDSNYHHLYYSDDNGQTYTSSKFSFAISSTVMTIVKPFNTNDAYMWVWSKSTKKIDIYKYDSGSNDFILTTNSNSTLVGTKLSNVAATYYNGSYHFYVSTYNSNYPVYYSSDEGVTWVQKNAGRDRPLEVVCADKPNTLISGFEDMKLSTNYGETWDGYGHKLGWDLQHMRTYEMAGGKHITLVGQDFGCYISETPEDKNSYTWCNNGASYGLHYDAASSENFHSIYMANQDRGATAYRDTSNHVNPVDVDGTDVLRVCFANREQSVWTWFYYGRIKHRFNFPTGKSGSAVYDGLGLWWAAPIIASPNPTEDAIYAAYGSNLQKFSYDAASNQIRKTAHPFDFKTQFASEIGGFGYSELNRNLWYVALNNGLFIYSKDAGETWTKSSYTGSKPKANDQSYNYPKNQIVIKASELDTNKVYYAGVGKIFLVSEDGGKTFTPKNRGLNIYRMRDFSLSPDEKYVFAACGYGGAWVYSVDDDYWYQMADDAVPSVDFTDVQVIKNKNCVRFSSFGSGVLDFTLDQSFNPIAIPENLTASLITNSQIELSWTDKSADEDGFYIERAIENDFVCIDTIGANMTTYTDNSIEYNQTSYYRIKAFKNDLASFKSNFASVTVPPKGILDPSNYTVISFDSEEIAAEDRAAKYAVDNNPDTYWHTAWLKSQPEHPHFIVIDLAQESTVAGFRYLPRQDGDLSGSIANYEFYVTNDLSDWGTPEITGEFGTGAEWKEVMFTQSAQGRYVKLVALSEINGGKYTSVAELAVLYDAVPPDAPTSFRALGIKEDKVLLAWTDNSLNETGFIIEQMIDGSFIAIDSTNAGYKSYAHTGLQPATTYTYRVRSYNSGGVSKPTAIAQATTKVSTGIEELKVNWSVYPNPCSENLNIQLSALNHNGVLKIIDLSGKIRISRNIEQGTTLVHLSMEQLPNGYYMVELMSEGKHVTQKILKN